MRARRNSIGRRPSTHNRPEHGEQVALIEWSARSRHLYPVAPGLSALDLLFAIPNAGGFSGGFAANVVRVKRLKREGVRPGVPDLMLAMPAGGWPGLFIEMKRASGSYASPEQREFMEKLRRVGYLAVVCNGFDEARVVIDYYLSPYRVRSVA